mgnify:CR=1 FL=1
MNKAFAPAEHPALADARTRSTPVNAAWLDGPAREVAARFAGMSDLLEIENQAAALLSATGWVREFLVPLAGALRADPWFEPPFKVSRDQLRTGAVLVDCPAVTIAATVTSAAVLNRLPAPRTIVVPSRITVTRYVRGGNAMMRRWCTATAGAEFSAAAAPPVRETSARVLSDGDLFRQDGRSDTHLMVRAQSDIVALTATIKPGASPLMREYAIADGSFVRAASSDDMASRIEMLLTFLRVSGRTDAGDVFDQASRHPAFHLRWASMREWLMLDAAGARERLARMCGDDPNAEIRVAAGATLAALDRRLGRPCPA